MKQVVCPRFIEWISTYELHSLLRDNGSEDDGTMTCQQQQTGGWIPHISPLSFFIDVTCGSCPIVAFAACPRLDEFEDSDDDDAANSSDGNYANSSDGNYGQHHDGACWKDVQCNAEIAGYFCVNFVSQVLL